jgi:hypothetical protein
MRNTTVLHAQTVAPLNSLRTPQPQSRISRNGVSARVVRPRAVGSAIRAGPAMRRSSSPDFPRQTDRREPRRAEMLSRRVPPTERSIHLLTKSTPRNTCLIWSAPCRRSQAERQLADTRPTTSDEHDIQASVTSRPRTTVELRLPNVAPVESWHPSRVHQRGDRHRR